MACENCGATATRDTPHGPVCAYCNAGIALDEAAQKRQEAAQKKALLEKKLEAEILMERERLAHKKAEAEHHRATQKEQRKEERKSEERARKRDGRQTLFRLAMSFGMTIFIMLMASLPTLKTLFVDLTQKNQKAATQTTSTSLPSAKKPTVSSRIGANKTTKATTTKSTTQTSQPRTQRGGKSKPTNKRRLKTDR